MVVGRWSMISAVEGRVSKPAAYASAHAGTDGRTRASGRRMVRAEHADARAKLGAAKRDHVLANMRSHHLAVNLIGVRQNVLDEVVAVLVAGNVDQGDAGTVNATLADAVEVAAKELRTPNLEALLDNLGGKLIHAVLGGKTYDVVNGAAAVSRGTVLANVLNAPVAKLAVGDNVNVGEDLLNAGAL